MGVTHMKKRLNYHELLKSWMQFYDMTAEKSRKLFASVWLRTQDAKTKTEEGAKHNGVHMERAGEPGEI